MSPHETEHGERSAQAREPGRSDEPRAGFVRSRAVRAGAMPRARASLGCPGQRSVSRVSQPSTPVSRSTFTPATFSTPAERDGAAVGVDVLDVRPAARRA